MSRRKKLPAGKGMSQKAMSSAVTRTGNHYFNKAKLQKEFVVKIRKMNDGK